MQILVVVDMQKDFVNGSLGTDEATKIVQKVAQKIAAFDGRVLYTRDTHEPDYFQTQEGKYLPVSHCIKNTDGWALCPEIGALCNEEPIDKPTFGSVELGELLAAANTEETITSITLIGLCTDICVISNALLIKAFLPETPIIVDASCCAGVNPESHQRALDAMKVCQITIINE